MPNWDAVSSPVITGSTGWDAVSSPVAVNIPKQDNAAAAPNAFERAQINKAEDRSFLGGFVDDLNPFSGAGSTVAGDMIEGAKSGVKAIGDLASSDYYNTPQPTPAADNLKAKRAAGTASINDYEKVFLEGGMNSPVGKLFQASQVIPSVNAVSTGVNKYVNPAIAKGLNVSPETVQIAEMGLPFLGKARGATGEITNPLNNLPEVKGVKQAISTNLTKPEAIPIEGDLSAAADPVGLKAMDAINKSYGSAIDKVSASEKAVKKVSVDIDAPDFNKVMEGAVTKIKNGLGQEGAGIVSDLEGIVGDIKKRSQVPDIYTSKPSGKININTNDLIDARRAINELMTSNKFPTTGTGSLMQAKGYIDSLIEQAKTNSPEFAGKYSTYRDDATHIAKKYTGNKALKPFWQPEDYVSYKAFKNGNADTPYSDTTLSRANEFLKNLNTDKTGRITAAVGALPPEIAIEVLKAAKNKANEANPGTVKAIAKGVGHALTGSPLSGLREVASTLTTKQKPNPINDFYKKVKLSDIGKQQKTGKKK